MAQQFSNVGIQDGAIIEASEISQSVEAFSGTKAYDITISGSLVITGSTVRFGPSAPPTFLLTGSLINDGPGQFLRMGISQPPSTTAQKVLKIKTNSGASPSPIVLIEGANAGDIPQLSLANGDVSYTFRANTNNDFEIVESSSVDYIPFTIAANSDDDTWTQRSNAFDDAQPGNIQIGPGTAIDLINMQNDSYVKPVGCIKSIGRVSGSILKADTTISASGVGVGTNANIYGTASYVSYMENVPTASYAASANPSNAGSIDFSYSISDQINSTHLNAKTGSIGILKLDSNDVTTMDNFGEGLYIGNPTDNYYVAISGSCALNNGIAWIGNPYEKINTIPPFIQIEQESTASNGYIKLGDQISGSSQIIFSRDPNAAFGSEDLYVNDDVVISGSVAIPNSNQMLQMEGYDIGNFLVFGSSSFFENSLEFHVKNTANIEPVARIANMHTAASSKLSFQIGDTGPHSSNSILEVSSSQDVKIPQGSLNYGLAPFPTGYEAFPSRELHAYESLGANVNDGLFPDANAGGYQRSIRCKPITTSSSTNILLISFVGEDAVGLKYPTTLGDGVTSQIYVLDVEAIAFHPIGGSNIGDGIYLKRQFIVRWNSSTDLWEALDFGTINRMSGGIFNNTFSNLGLTGYFGLSGPLGVTLIPGTGYTLNWSSWITVKTIASYENL